MLPKLSSSSSFNSYLSNLFASENDIPMVRRSVDVDAEYTEAFHTKSFLNIWAEAHKEPKPTPSPTKFQLNSNSNSNSNFLLEPTQSSLVAAASASDGGGGGGAALLDYLDATLQSSSACGVLLTAINRTRSIDRSVRHHLLHRHTDAADLSAYIDLGNPLSSQNLSPFHRTHSLYPPLLARLTEERRRIRRAARALRAAKKAAGIVIIAAVGTAVAVAVAAVILTHAAAAMVAAAVVPAIRIGGWRRRWRRSWVSVKWMEKEERKVDAAARGAYIVGRDMDTLSRMVRRVHDEMEHRRDVVRLILLMRSTASGDELIGDQMMMAREVMRELEMGQIGFEEQIEELEEHVYLCLLTINRSRRLVHASSMH